MSDDQGIPFMTTPSYTHTRKMRVTYVAAVAGVSGAHHVLGVELLLRQLRHCQRAVLLGAAAA